LSVGHSVQNGEWHQIHLHIYLFLAWVVLLNFSWLLSQINDHSFE